MATEFSGGGDPGRSIALLWRVAGANPQGARRGPKPRHSVDEVVAAAIQLADAEGLAAISMRHLAEALGISAMSLYTYVPSKAELVDLMLDRVAAEDAHPDASPGDWRSQVTRLARQRWAMAQRHPWVLQVGVHRPPLGPNILARVEATLSAIDGIGLSETEMDQVTSLVGDYVRGAVRAALEAREIEKQTGMTDEQWWAMNTPLLEGLVDPARFPTTVKIGEAFKAGRMPPPNHERNFEFGLQRVLDGIESFIAGRKTAR
ncbi:TetR/AcrR family transcriptional regulator [Phenylobacterium sp.]|jgi:AcrR family transcriptional regulator|uniref:TetR/AcrR family transcriptional regulator n=1 Tax=Phenylobacterium sp. TaxID=1871053 RepID=UPI002E346AF6|nr:TetR/AcrR family transcriptional regulator [Phenylobacterium sp.]HEX3366460.1 TetR/AcrR family transcriptional regulator [Phenylobacterium sp.]